MDKINNMNEIPQENKSQGQLSPEVRKILEEEAKEAEVKAAIDAAAEEGMIVTREEAKKILFDNNAPK